MTNKGSRQGYSSNQIPKHPQFFKRVFCANAGGADVAFKGNRSITETPVKAVLYRGTGKNKKQIDYAEATVSVVEPLDNANDIIAKSDMKILWAPNLTYSSQALKRGQLATAIGEVGNWWCISWNDGTYGFVPKSGEELDNKTIIWYYLKNNLPGLAPNGSLSSTIKIDDRHVAAIMGNMQHESGFSPTNAEDYNWDRIMGFSPYRTHNPEYIPNYSDTDGVGWGLIQWTYNTRKSGLRLYAASKGKSVGDLITQLEYLVLECTGKPRGILYTNNSPTGEINYGDINQPYIDFLNINNLNAATEHFYLNIEISRAGSLLIRQGYAAEILAWRGGN